jgi:hypothetical protein
MTKKSTPNSPLPWYFPQYFCPYYGRGYMEHISMLLH